MKRGIRTRKRAIMLAFTLIILLTASLFMTSCGQKKIDVLSVTQEIKEYKGEQCLWFKIGVQNSGATLKYDTCSSEGAITGGRLIYEDGTIVTSWEGDLQIITDDVLHLTRKKGDKDTEYITFKCPVPAGKCSLSFFYCGNEVKVADLVIE